MSSLREMLLENPIIAAIRNKKDLEKVVESKATIVFVLYGDILGVPNICARLKESGKTVFVHVDFIEGLLWVASARPRFGTTIDCWPAT